MQYSRIVVRAPAESLAKGFAVAVLLATTLIGCAETAPEAPATARVPTPVMILPAAWGSKPLPIPVSRRHVPVRVTLHHAGVTWKSDADPFTKILALQGWGQREKDWPDVPYHFLVAPDGRVFVGRSLEFAGETNTEYQTSGHALVQLWGNFEAQRVPLAQLTAAVRLVAWLCQEYAIPVSEIAGHRDHSRQTTCPGADLGRYLVEGSFREWVASMLRGEEPAVVLGAALKGGPTTFAGE